MSRVISGEKKKFFTTTLSTSCYAIFFLLSFYKIRRVYVNFISDAKSSSVAFLSHSFYRHSLYLHFTPQQTSCFPSVQLIIKQIKVTVLRLDFAITLDVFSLRNSLRPLLFVNCYLHLIVSCYSVANGFVVFIYHWRNRECWENTIDKSPV